jgi:hypothetical protein
MIVPVDAYWEQLLAATTANVVAGNFAGLLHAAKMNLFTNNIGLTNLLLYASFTLPTAPGVVEQAVAFPAAATRNRLGGFELNAPALTFQMSDDTTPAGYYGYIVYQLGTPNILLYAELFGNILSLNDTWDAIIIAANVAFGGSGYGEATIEP